MRRTKRKWQDDEDSGGDVGSGYDAICETCRNENPHIRYSHYLALAKLDGIEGIKKHLENATTFKEHIRTGVVQWVRDQFEMWSGLADAATGQAIPWHAARQLAIEDLTKLGPVDEDRKLGDMVTALRQADHAQKTSRDRAWVQGHAALHEQGLNAPGREKDAAAYCREMAQQHPQDAAEWRREAETYERMAGGTPAWMVDDDINDPVPF